jgi:hypothetical protein
MTNARSWADLHVAGWSDTKQNLHLYTQLLGKMRVQLSPPQPNWMHTALSLTARGIATGPMPCGEESVEATIDVFDSQIVLAHSGGGVERIALFPARAVADVYAACAAALERLGVACFITPVPQETPDQTPLDADRRERAYDPAAVRRWFDTVTAIAGIFDRWRAPFFGRSGIPFWWGAFDLAVILFNGKHVPPPVDRGYLMKYDLDAELMNAGFYLGDESTAPFFYGYIHPEPAGAATLSMRPAGATWSTALHEWTLSYDAVRSTADPAVQIRAFLDALYAHCVDAAGWEREALRYVMPPRPHPKI